MQPKRFEIELTNACNAVCKDCKRTHLINAGKPFEIKYITPQDLHYFDEINMFGSKVKFCGVLGDPIANKDLFEITEYFILEKGVTDIEVSTNAGLKTPAWWKQYGELSAMSNGIVNVHFAIDGFTRNDYRVNVNLDKAMKNMEAYVEGGGKGIWQFIIFDYNKDEVDLARTRAKELGLGFATRTAWRNDATPKEKHAIEIKAIEKTYEDACISCQHLNTQEIFIGADKTVWPCCYLYDEYVTKGSDRVYSLEDDTLLNILNNEWYNGLLEKSLDKNHPLNIPRCWKSCGDNGKRKNQKNIETES